MSDDISELFELLPGFIAIDEINRDAESLKKMLKTELGDIKGFLIYYRQKKKNRNLKPSLLKKMS